MRYRILVVIPHRNGPALLLRALSALSSALDPLHDLVVIVDNGSADDSIAVARRTHPECSVVDVGANLGFGAACNLGMRSRASEYVLFLNNDCELTRAALERLLAALDAHPAAVIAGPQLTSESGAPQRSAAFLPTISGEMGLARKKFPVRTTGSETRRVEALVGACMLGRRAALEVVRGFDENFFFYFEEVDLCRRLTLAGGDILLVPEARVVHGKGVATRALRTEAQMEMLRSRFIYYRRAFSKSAAAWLVLFRWTRLLVSCISHLMLMLVTLGLHRVVRQRSAIYIRLVTFVLAGMPRNMGLPGKRSE